MSVQQAELPEIIEWRKKLDGLYDDIRTWVAEMSPSPTVEVHSIAINEKRSGEYQVPQLLVKRGDGEFWVRPIAKWVVGADGRVDLEGGEGPFILVWMVEKSALINKPNSMIGEADIDDWFWVQDRAPWGREQLNGARFRELAELCLR
jgi:hypothetical protein